MEQKILSYDQRKMKSLLFGHVKKYGWVEYGHIEPAYASESDRWKRSVRAARFLAETHKLFGLTKFTSRYHTNVYASHKADIPKHYKAKNVRD